MGAFTRFAHSPILANPAISLAFTALSLLLLVLVLLSVPGPIKGLYWFSVEGEQSGQGNMNVGVLGWCCKYSHFLLRAKWRQWREVENTLALADEDSD
jgi:hypothetical protein